MLERSEFFNFKFFEKRPFGQRVANIGTWQNALGLLGLAAVIVNCALIGLSGQVTRLWPGLTTTQTIILIVTLEHIMLGLRSALKYVNTLCLGAFIAHRLTYHFKQHCRSYLNCHRGWLQKYVEPNIFAVKCNAEAQHRDKRHHHQRQRHPRLSRMFILRTIFSTIRWRVRSPTI